MPSCCGPSTQYWYTGGRGGSTLQFPVPGDPSQLPSGRPSSTWVFMNLPLRTEESAPFLFLVRPSMVFSVRGQRQGKKRTFKSVLCATTNPHFSFLWRPWGVRATSSGYLAMRNWYCLRSQHTEAEGLYMVRAPRAT